MTLANVTSFAECTSEEEQRQRPYVTAINIFVWTVLVILTISSLGVLLLVALVGLGFRYLLAEYQVRRIQAMGATVSPRQLVQVHRAAEAVCQKFGVSEVPRIVVVPSGEANALAIRFARHRVVVILSELLEGIIDQPGELRFLLAHEICHLALDQGARGCFELAKPARYRQARELTCDNAGLAAAEASADARAVIHKLCVGPRLHARLEEEALEDEADQIYTGFSGWLLSQYLTHPPAGRRLRNLSQFAAEHPASLGFSRLSASSPAA